MSDTSNLPIFEINPINSTGVTPSNKQQQPPNTQVQPIPGSLDKVKRIIVRGRLHDGSIVQNHTE